MKDKSKNKASGLLSHGLNERKAMSEDPKTYGMDNMPDPKNQKPMATPKENVSAKGKNFTIC